MSSYYTKKIRLGAKICKMPKKDNSRPQPLFSQFTQTKPVLILLSSNDAVRHLIRRMYSWVVGWAEKPQAEKALSSIAFAEGSFFPIPPDPLIIAMVTARPKKWFRIATIGTIGSVLGGVTGYFVGMFLFSTIGQWIINTYSLQQQYESARDLFLQHAF